MRLPQNRLGICYVYVYLLLQMVWQMYVSPNHICNAIDFAFVVFTSFFVILLFLVSMFQYIYILVLFHRSPFLCCCCFFRIVLYLHSLWQKCRRSSNSHLTRDYQWQESNTPCQRCVCSIYCSIVQHWIQSNHFFFIQQTPAVLLLD